MVEGKKISELGIVTSINDGCCFPLLSNGATKRITFAVLLENIIDNLVLPENQQIKELKEKISNIDTSIELTDQQVEKIKKQIEEIQKDVNSQDEIIVKYVKLFEELKEAYDRVEVAGGIIDDELNVNSEHAISNKAVAQLIPPQASAENQLADKDFVNSSISTATAEFIGTFNSLAELQSTTKNYDNNDYSFVIEKDSNGNTQYSRYKWNGSSWIFEYVLNNSSFTSEQWKAINSNVTKDWKDEIDLKITQSIGVIQTYNSGEWTLEIKSKVIDVYYNKMFNEGAVHLSTSDIFTLSTNVPELIKPYLMTYNQKFLLSANIFFDYAAPWYQIHQIYSADGETLSARYVGGGAYSRSFSVKAHWKIFL